MAVGCEAPTIEEGAVFNQIGQQAGDPPPNAQPVEMSSACQTVDGVITHPDDYYAMQGNCAVSVIFRAGAVHGNYRLALNAYTPIKFQAVQGEEISPDGHALSWNQNVLSGAELTRNIPFTFYPNDTPSGRTMNGVYGIKVCRTHLEVGTQSCTIAKFDRPDRTWQAIGADWRFGQTELGYYFAEQSANESWFFIRLESPIDGFQPEMTIRLQDGLRIMTEPAYKPYYLQVAEGGQSAEISPFHLGSMFGGEMRIVVMRVQHDGKTDGKLPARVTVRSDTHNYWEDSVVLLATSRNADGTLQITQQDNPNSQTGIAEPRIDPPAPGTPILTKTITLPPPEPTITVTVSPTATPTCKRCRKMQLPTNIEWTHLFVAPYTMHRFDAYTNHMLPEVYPHLSLDQFLHWFLVNNPQAHNAVLYEGETYNFPKLQTPTPR